MENVDVAYPPVQLANIGNRPNGIIKGRSPYEGYQRGITLSRPEAKAAVEAHPLCAAALPLARGRTVMMRERLLNLFLLITSFAPRLASQNVIEFGSYKGGSALFMAHVLKAVSPGAKVYALDTFEGMPPTRAELDLHGAGDFSDTSLQEIEAVAEEWGLDNLVLVKGLVEDTFPAAIPEGTRFGIAHIDLDIYAPIRHCQRILGSVLVPGAYAAYDDATAPSCIGATQAVEEYIQERGAHSEQIFPHFVFRHGL